MDPDLFGFPQTVGFAVLQYVASDRILKVVAVIAAAIMWYCQNWILPLVQFIDSGVTMKERLELTTDLVRKETLESEERVLFVLC